MTRKQAAIAAGVIVLVLWHQHRARNGSSSSSSTSGVTFPPVVPIGGGLNQQQPEYRTPGIFGGFFNSLAEGVSMTVKLARGLRNNNPLNIENNPRNPWKGLASNGGDSRYAVFTDVKYGIRAAGRVLDSYISNGFSTIEAIINRWAPPNENNTSSYLAHIQQATGWSRSYRPSRADYAKLIAVMIKHENGINPYSLEELAAWVNIA